MAASTRERMVVGAADLISRRGVHATTLREVVRYTGTPRGSLSHHFPGGKQEMLEDAIRYASDTVSAPLAQLLQAEGAVTGLRSFVGWWRRVLKKSDFEAGCPVLAVAVEPVAEGDDADADSNRLRQLAREAFDRWQSILAEALRREGVPQARARRLAALVVASIEGTVAMCRAERSVGPLDDVLVELEVAFKAALADARG